MESSAVVLIDGAYYSKIVGRFGLRPDLERLSEALCGSVPRLRTYFYDALPWISKSNPNVENAERLNKKQDFFNALTFHSRFEVRQGRIQKTNVTCPKCHGQLSCSLCVHVPPKFGQKLVDVLLSVDLVRLAWSKQADYLVLIAGDSDFVPAVRAAKDAGAVVKVVYAKTSTTALHTELRQVCDERFELTPDFLAQFQNDATLKASSLKSSTS